MQSPAQIVFRDVPRSDALDARINEKIGHLERFFDRITHCRVMVEAPHRHQTHGRIYEVHIQIGVPGTELIVDREKRQNPAHADLEVAINDAFKAAERRLKDYQRQVLRGDVKLHEERPVGRVCRLVPEEGYGFIETLDGSEIYFHEHSLNGTAFKDLEIGMRVRFSPGMGERGPQASAVMPE